MNLLCFGVDPDQLKVLARSNVGNSFSLSMFCLFSLDVLGLFEASKLLARRTGFVDNTDILVDTIGLDSSSACLEDKCFWVIS